MASLIAMPLEILHLIFRALQSVTAGPRYVLRKPLIDPWLPGGVASGPKIVPENHAKWTRTDAGPLHLASSCRYLRDIYFSPYVSFNLILEIADPPGTRVEADKYYNFWGDKLLNGDLQNHLKLLQVSFDGKPLTRFEFHSRWNFDPLNPGVQHMDMWTEILRDVSEVFGNELMVVVCAFGDDVERDLINHAPRRIRVLAERARSLGGGDFEVTKSASLPVPSVERSKVTTRSRANQLPEERPDLQYPMSNTPQLADAGASRPLALHVYCNYARLSRADILMGRALEMFANKHLQSFYYSSDPSNFEVAGGGRRPAYGRELYQIKNQFAMGNPWRFFLPSIAQAYQTLESITLDCALFWSEIAYCLPYLHKLKYLDCELVLMYTEPMYPYKLETKGKARRRIKDTVTLKDSDIAKQKAMKKNKDKKWIDVKDDDVKLPIIEPCKNDMGMVPRSRFSSVQMEVCLQVGKARIAKGRRE
jgi:hypothetical protein